MTPAIRRTLLGLAAGALAWTFSASAQMPGHWVTTTKFAPVPNLAEEYWGITAGGKYYLFGGTPERSPGRSVLPGRVLEYDPASDKWTSKKQMPRPADHMAVAESGGKIYLFGGATTERPGDTGPDNFQLNDSWEYNPADDSWKALAPMPTRRNAASAAAAGGKIYVIGGNGVAPGAANPVTSPENFLMLGTNEAYDPAANTWETRRPMPTARNHAAIGTVAGKIYLIGGRVGGANVGNFVSSPTDIVEQYDPATDRWLAMNKMPTPRSGVGWAVHQGRIYVLGGEVRDYHMDAIFRDFEAFDPATNQWFRLPPMPTARHGVNVAALGNRLHAIGGHVAFAATGEHHGDTDAHEVFEFPGS